jgi:hypothetical protein
MCCRGTAGLLLIAPPTLAGASVTSQGAKTSTAAPSTSPANAQVPPRIRAMCLGNADCDRQTLRHRASVRHPRQHTPLNGGRPHQQPWLRWRRTPRGWLAQFVIAADMSPCISFSII